MPTLPPARRCAGYAGPGTAHVRGRAPLAGRGSGFWARAYSASSQPEHGSELGSGGRAPRVCILGGGFGGLYTAVKLESLMWPRGTKPQITLIDQGDRFVFKPLLYELLSGAASEDEVAPPYAQLLAPYPVAFRQARVASVQLEHPTQVRQQEVVLHGGPVAAGAASSAGACGSLNVPPCCGGWRA